MKSPKGTSLFKDARRHVSMKLDQWVGKHTRKVLHLGKKINGFQIQRFYRKRPPG